MGSRMNAYHRPEALELLQRRWHVVWRLRQAAQLPPACETLLKQNGRAAAPWPTTYCSNAAQARPSTASCCKNAMCIPNCVCPRARLCARREGECVVIRQRSSPAKRLGPTDQHAFTQDARYYVSMLDSKIILINGKRLAELMIDHRVGVTPLASYEVKRRGSRPTSRSLSPLTAVTVVAPPPTGHCC